jgi:hypothetical protein
MQNKAAYGAVVIVGAWLHPWLVAAEIRELLTYIKKSRQICAAE